MSIPKPIHSLDGHCSIVHEKTLYVYSPAGFQSLKLEEGAEWQTEPMDVSLTGAQCVKAVPGGDQNAAKLYIVGGSVNETAATWDYPGLMHYSFAEKKWDWVRAESWVTQNRQNHAATYLADSQQLLVYAGSQTTGNVGPSSETFLISTVPPFVIQATSSAGAPPSVMPMLMDVDSSRALMVGGGASNTAVYTFSQAEGWRNLQVTLPQPITNQATVQCAIVKGDDGSLVLEQFDLGVSPNKVSRLLLLDQNGNVAQPGTTIGDKTKRVTVNDWPTYNETFAPTVTRNGYSIAQDNSGLTVVTGGNAEEPISVFDSQANSWLNTTELFNGQQILKQTTSSTASSSLPSSTASATASPSPTTEAAAPATTSSSNNKDRMLTVLGATLGTIFGIAAILILLLFCLKYKKSKKKGQQTGYIEKDRLSFADRGAEFMKEAGGSVSGGYTHNNDSLTSLAIINGNGHPGHRRNMASDASTAGLVKKPSPLGYSDPVEMSKFDLKPEPVSVVRQNSGRAPPASKGVGRSRSSGWSRYFANNEATNLANIPADRSTFASDRSSGISQSNYSSTRMYNHPSQTVPPLEIPRLDGQRLSRVASGSPTLGNSRENLPHQLHQPMQAELGRANSNGSSRSGLSHHDDYYLRKPVDSWTPVGDDERPPSSNYTNSMVFADNHNRRGDGASSYYPDNTSSFYPKSNFSSFYPGQGKLDIRESTNTMFPTGAGGDTPEMPKYSFGDLNPPSPQLGVPQHLGRESTATVFPPSNPAQGAAYGDDMPKSKFSSMYPAPPRLDGQTRESAVTIFPSPNGPTAQAGEMGHGGLSSFYPSPPRVGHESTVTMFPQAGQPQGGKQQDMSWLNLGAMK